MENKELRKKVEDRADKYIYKKNRNLFIEGADYAISLIEQQENKWVNYDVSPTKDGRYLCFMESGYMGILYCEKGRFKFDNEVTAPVTHWMPLPEKPNK